MAACKYPTVRFVCWEERSPWGKIFVPDPIQRGRYILTEKCVAQVACPLCKSIPSMPCKGMQGYGSGIHIARRYEAESLRRQQANDIYEDAAGQDEILEETDV